MKPLHRSVRDGLLPGCLGLLGLVLAFPAAAQLPVGDNTHPPYMGVYVGSVNADTGNTVGVQRNEAYAAWLGRSSVWGHDTFPSDSWDDIQGEKWILKPWSDWVQADPGHRRMVFSVPLLPGPLNGSGPAKGLAAGVPVSLAQGAGGAYDAYYQALAQNLVRYGLGNSILRLGWEWNGNWYAWECPDAAHAANFAAYWRQIVDTMRAVPGAQNLQFNWNASNRAWMNYPADDAWPGDNYVDFVGADVYDASWAANSYPWPAGDSATDILARQKWVWANVVTPKSQFGIAYWAFIAGEHAKPLTFPEWGLLSRSDGHGGLDDPYFVQQMYNYIQNPANNVYFASYFDFNGGSSGDSRLSGVDGSATVFPGSKPLFVQLFTPGPAAPFAPNGNASWPYVGVFKGNLATAGAGADATLLGTAALWAEDSLGSGTWDNVEGASWELSPWSAWVAAASGRRLVLSVPLVPGAYDGSGTASGTGSGTPITLAQGAAGAYNAYFVALAQNLVHDGLGNTILRLGPDFNTGANAWHATTDADAVNFAAYWRQVVAAMRSVPGASGLKFDWDVSIAYMAYDPDDAFPGNSYVDYVGLDLFDVSTAANTYPWPVGDAAADILARQTRVWSTVLAPESAYGIDYWKAFAASHFKPLAFPAWGIAKRGDGHGGLDDLYFMQQMAAVVQDPDNDVFWHAYYDLNDWTGDHQLFPAGGGLSAEFPNAAGFFQSAYGTP